MPGSYYFPIRVYLVWNADFAAIRETLARMPSGDSELARNYRFEVEAGDDQYEAALAVTDEMPEYYEDQITMHSRAAYRARCYAAMGDPEGARTAYQEAAVLLERMVAENDQDFRPFSDLGPVLAALGRRDEAIVAAKRAVELMPTTKDAEAGVQPADNLALTHAILGDYDTARNLAEERIQARPGVLTITGMRLDPRWSGFLASPQGQELARKF